MKIACLHTAQSNVAVFDKAARALNLPQDALTHKVMPHLLEQAQAAGGVTPEIEKETIAALADLRTDADVVLLTCSTLGGAADFLAQDPGIMRVDARWRSDGDRRTARRGALRRANHAAPDRRAVSCNTPADHAARC